MLEIVGKPTWWFILLFIPFVNIRILIIVMNLLSKSYGKGTCFTIGLIFLPIILIHILGFGDAKYECPSMAKRICWLIILRSLYLKAPFYGGFFI